MNSNNIPVEINDSNLNINPKRLSFDVNSDVIILNDPSDYEVIIEKMKLPLNGIPISNQDDFSIIFESLDKDNCPPKLTPAGFLNTKFNDKIYSISQFCDLFNEHLRFNLTNDFCYGYLSYDSATKMLTWNENNSEAKKFIKIWVDYRLQKLLDGLPLLEESYMEYRKHFALFGSKDIDSYYFQTKSTSRFFYKIVSLRCYSNLPTEIYYLVNNEKKTIERSNLLTSIDLKDEELIDIDVIYYHPASFRHYSMISSLPLTGFRAFFTVYYVNGEEENIYLNEGEHASLSIKFVKK